MRLGLALFIAMVSSCTSTEEVSRELCVKVRDHLVALRMDAYSQMTDASGAKVDLEPHRKALAQALGANVDRCVATYTVAQIRCSLASTALGSATACLRR
jgi:hypothetical protein